MLNTLLDYLVVGTVAVLAVLYTVRQQRRYLASVKRLVEDWANRNQITLDFGKTEFEFSDAYKRLVVVHGTDRSGVERKYTLKATRVWAYSLLKEPLVVASEPVRATSAAVGRQ